MAEPRLDRMPADVRYHKDPVFHSLVDVLYLHILEAQYTPTELREACHLAACRYELEHVKPIFFDPTKPFEWNLKP